MPPTLSAGHFFLHTIGERDIFRFGQPSALQPEYIMATRRFDDSSVAFAAVFRPHSTAPSKRKQLAPQSEL
jgi:hypothetical protein